MTEEVHQVACDDAGCVKMKKDNEPFRLGTDYSFDVNEAVYIDTRVTTAIHHSELLPLDFVADIPTPPPNC